MRAVLLLILCGVLGRAEIVYRVRLSASEGGAIVEMPAEKYVAAVVAGEAGSFRNPEALKAMAVTARTYAAHYRSRHSGESYDFCATTHCQRMILREATGRFEEAAKATRGQLLWFQTKPALAVYTQDCGGKSEASRALWTEEDAPYLRVHEDPYCAGRMKWWWSVETAKLRGTLQAAGMQVPGDLRQLVVLRRTASGRAHTLSLQGEGESKLISASSFRFAVGRTMGWNTLRSEAYDVSPQDGKIRFEGRGAGHGVGLCEDGADEMAARGHTYQQILEFYYSGTKLSVLANDVPWTKVRGHSATVFAVQREVAAQALATTEHEMDELRASYDLPQAALQIYVYPDEESYRNGTGEPGWVAAHTAGTKIETQPLAILQQHGGFRRVIRHELLHTMIENAARPNVPLWFREGLVQYLAGERVGGKPVELSLPLVEESIRTRVDGKRTNDAYQTAYQRVVQLQQHYGTAELLRWLRNGVPAEVTRSSNNRSPTNSR